ncbi:hypothetical protein QY97_03704 [Bacillus thermotolerans]|nr:hypothetical protein QY97_03704 [Bacillus thermotolerans]
MKLFFIDLLYTIVYYFKKDGRYTIVCKGKELNYEKRKA